MAHILPGPKVGACGSCEEVCSEESHCCPGKSQLLEQTNATHDCPILRLVFRLLASRGHENDSSNVGSLPPSSNQNHLQCQLTQEEPRSESGPCSFFYGKQHGRNRVPHSVDCTDNCHQCSSFSRHVVTPVSSIL